VFVDGVLVDDGEELELLLPWRLPKQASSHVRALPRGLCLPGQAHIVGPTCRLDCADAIAGSTATTSIEIHPSLIEAPLGES